MVRVELVPSLFVYYCFAIISIILKKLYSFTLKRDFKKKVME
jgi:hypothetical protein